jgi:hypothetical protein
VRKRFGAGSKSDREAVVLQTDDDELVLRREGGNAFSDPALDELVGHRIRGVGRRAGYTFIMKDWEDVKPAPPGAARKGKPSPR